MRRSNRQLDSPANEKREKGAGWAKRTEPTKPIRQIRRIKRSEVLARGTLYKGTVIGKEYRRFLFIKHYAYDVFAEYIDSAGVLNIVKVPLNLRVSKCEDKYPLGSTIWFKVYHYEVIWQDKAE